MIPVDVEISKPIEKMVKEFQCSGCTLGNNTKCGSFKLGGAWGQCCESHSAGTFMSLAGRIALGLPKGFNRYGGSVPPSHENQLEHDKHLMHIRLWVKGTKPEWGKLNVAVWAMVENGYLFVRTYAPRINKTAVDVIEGGTLDMCPGALNVAEFIDEID